MSHDVAPPTPSPATSTLVPSRDLYRAAMRRDLMLTVPLAVLLIGAQLALQWSRPSSRADGSAEFFTWLCVGLVVAGTAFSIYYMRALLTNSRVDLGGSALTVTNWLGRSRVIAYADVAAVLQPTLRLPTLTLPALVLLDRGGKRALTMYGTLWPTESLVDVASATGVRPTTFPAPLSYRELRKLHPGAVGWARANPIALALIVAAGLLLVIIVALVIVFSILLREFNGL
jgi:hypothetical protein